MRRAETRVMALLAAAILSGQVMAQAAKAPEPASRRPEQPVKINADRAEWEKGGAMVYSGNVHLESGDLKLSGERLQLTQFGNGQFEARVTGAPATLDHAGLAVGETENRKPVSAKAKQLNYDSRSEIVEIEGEAMLTRGADEIRGEKVRYDVVNRRIEAAGGVQIVIQPPAPAPTPAPGAPAPPVTR